MANQPTPPNFDRPGQPPWRPQGQPPRQTLPAIDIASNGPLPDLSQHVPAQTGQTTAHPEHFGRSRATGDHKFWLNGEVLLCACPDCSAPMTVRLWLMLADCWQCGVCIELTEEEEREALRVWEQHRAHEVAAPAAARVAEPARVLEPAYAAERVGAGVPAHSGSLTASDPGTPRQPLIQHVPAAPPRTVAPALESARRSGTDWRSESRLSAFFPRLPPVTNPQKADCLLSSLSSAVIGRGPGWQWPGNQRPLQYACADRESLRRPWRISRLHPTSIDPDSRLGGRRDSPRAKPCRPSTSRQMAHSQICPNTSLPRLAKRPHTRSTSAAAARQAITSSGLTAKSSSVPVPIAALQ